jgi:acyl carrier protein
MMIHQLNTVFQDVFDDPTLAITHDTCPTHIPDWDSIAQLKLVLAVEESFGIDLQDEDVGNLRTAGDFLAAVGKRIAA